jgi:hypothetical protein
MDLLKSKERKELYVLSMMYRIPHNVAPDYLNSLLIKMTDVHSIKTRSHNLYLQIPVINYKIFQNSFISGNGSSYLE